MCLRHATAIAALLAVAALGVGAGAAEMYFAGDQAGEVRIGQIQEGARAWVAVDDPDQNRDSSLREKIWADIVIMDPHTGAHANWDTGGYYGTDVSLAVDTADYLVETDPDSGLFVSSRSFRLGSRENFADRTGNTHTVGPDFIAGNHVFLADERLQLRVAGRFENMDTIVGMYQDPDDETDVALTAMKIIDTQAMISWEQEVLESFDSAATILVVDADENLNPSEIEYVPVFILVNPGSWNPVIEDSPTAFGALLRGGGVDQGGVPVGDSIGWHNIYGSPSTDAPCYVQYPTDGNVVEFDTTAPDGIARALYYARETAPDTGEFRLELGRLAEDLGFNGLLARDVLVAYYLDPNDFDDFALATATLEEQEHPEIRFTNSDQVDQDVYWVGRAPVYLAVTDPASSEDGRRPEQAIVEIYNPHSGDGEWAILDEASANSPNFLTHAGFLPRPVWDALGVGSEDSRGGFQLEMDNWQIEAFNEDSLYARYTAATYAIASLAGLGDLDAGSTYPPTIDRVSARGGIAFDVVKVEDTQVFDGTTTQMHFLDRTGVPIVEHTGSSCVFVEVIDLDQNEDSYRREKLVAYWGGGQNQPFGPQALNAFNCGVETDLDHPISPALGDTCVFNLADAPNMYLLNPRNGRWAPLDLIETATASGQFVSTMCIDLGSVHECAPSLDAVPGDTIIAVYQDPSNHSDSAWIAIEYRPDED